MVWMSLLTRHHQEVEHSARVDAHNTLFVWSTARSHGRSCSPRGWWNAIGRRVMTTVQAPCSAGTRIVSASSADPAVRRLHGWLLLRMLRQAGPAIGHSLPVGTG